MNKNTARSLFIGAVVIALVSVVSVVVSAKDSDGDGRKDPRDNCPYEANASQEDMDGDGQGDICDIDIDGDGFINEHEIIAETDPKDASSKPDPSADDDRDGIPNKDDRCPASPIGRSVDAQGCAVVGVTEMLDDYSDEIALNAPHTEPMIPKWGFGYMQSGWGEEDFGYDSQEGFLDHARALRGIENRYGNHRYPADIMVLDMYWTGKEWSWPGNMTWDLNKFPDPEGLIDSLHEMNFKLMMNYHEGGFGEEWLAQLQRDLDYGLDIVWLDFWRADSQYEKRVWELLRNHHGEDKRIMFMARHYARPNHHNQESILGGDYMRTPNEEPLEKAMPIHWTGDVLGDWKGFAETIEAIVHSDDGAPGGWSYLHADTPGHTKGEDPELALRWMQFSDFTTSTRNHGTTPRDVWSWGDQVEKLSYQSRMLRYRLLPYIYTYSWHIWQDAMPLTRPLRLAYPGEADDNRYVYLFGEEILVAPVYKSAASFPGEKMDVYLPKGDGSQWVDYWTHQVYEGGQTIQVDASMDTHPHIPLFVKRGAIIPMGPEIFHIDPAVHADPITLDVYPKERGESSFTLYDDDGETLGYQRGEQSFSRISVVSSDKQLEIVVGAHKGEYAGKPKTHNYRVKLNLIERDFQPPELNGDSLPALVDIDSENPRGWLYDKESKIVWIKFSSAADQENRVVLQYN
ncbi:DUF5110 domain-containing protein [Microbulbifer agarilyticus]|uniref:TIM-barrel domain-containing protein n=1 Tax=Microbulbifer agarilyticus TaxID=260552 RepID=UPI001C956B4F|nr:TIM-barrel domain-containing protein [Microbulbifer agarilyticus]MBY6212819.1 DUF5110 domain-containing protein [Microbulbifer agarilyticus]